MEMSFTGSFSSFPHDSSDRCFACGRLIGRLAKERMADTRDGQTVAVGADCMKKIEAAGGTGYQPPKGGPRLYPISMDKTP